LYRRQRAIVADNRAASWDTPILLRRPDDLAAYGEMCCHKSNPDATAYPDILYFPNPTDLTVPQRRLGMDPRRDGGWPIRADLRYPTLGEDDPPGLVDSPQGADFLLSDVLSFDVRVWASGANRFVDLYGVNAETNPLFNQPTGPRVFDTWSTFQDDRYDYSTWNVPGTPKTVPLRMVVPAVQITLRLWDFKTQRVRQLTMVQDL
jgi:hypothetical protein